MEFVQGREGCCENEEEELNGNMGKLPFSSTSSFSASFPSSSQYKGSVHQPIQGWGSQIYHEEAMRSHDQEAFKFGVGKSLTNFNQKPELMHLSPRYTDNNGQVESDCGGGSSNGGDVVCIEREHMFDKVVTPSDVGKLNRLVIPKQHAEKYFPLDSSANEKGLLLNFEDRTGKPWRFRYSYWNSSQSYVMTKGWSRFVKDKKLYAGDIVSFERGAGELGKDHLYIDWRHQPPDRAALHPLPLSLARSVPWGGLFLPPTMSQLNYHPHHHHHQTGYEGSTYGYNVVNPGAAGSIYYLRSSDPQQVGVVQQGGDVPIVFDSVPVVHGKAAAKRLRLFGVNMECPVSEVPNCDVLSSTTIQNTTMASHSPHQLPPSHLPLQLRLYNGASIPTMPIQFPTKGKQSLSLDLDIFDDESRLG